MTSKISLKILENILISRRYEQFSRNDSAKAPQWLQKKISNFKNMNICFEEHDLEILNMQLLLRII